MTLQIQSVVISIAVGHVGPRTGLTLELFLAHQREGMGGYELGERGVDGFGGLGVGHLNILVLLHRSALGAVDYVGGMQRVRAFVVLPFVEVIEHSAVYQRRFPLRHHDWDLRSVLLRRVHMDLQSSA